MQFYCAKCHLPITNEIQKVNGLYVLNEEDKEDYLPRGYFIVSNGEYFTGSEGKLLINKADLINCKEHSDSRRLNGCCGLDGMDGINKICVNGHEIGTEKSDCWHSHAVIIESEAVFS